MKGLRCFVVDGKRLLDSRNLLYGIIGVALYLLTARLEDMKGDGVVYIVTMTMYVNSAMLVIMLGYEIFGNSIMNDFKNRYIYQVYLRSGNLVFYTISKTFWIFLSAMLGVGLGVALFALCVKPGHVWADELTTYLIQTPWGGVYKNHHYFLFLLLVGMQFGVLAGMMAMIGCLISLFVQNRWLAGSAALIAAYGFNFLGGIFEHSEVPFLGIYLFMENMTTFADKWLLHGGLLALLFYVVGTILIYARIRWRLRYE